jgi:hypothetical protein
MGFRSRVELLADYSGSNYRATVRIVCDPCVGVASKVLAEFGFASSLPETGCSVDFWALG